MENLISGLIVAAVGGLSFIAYRHPQEYRRVALCVLGLGFAMALASALYRHGLMTGARFGSNPAALDHVLYTLEKWSFVGLGVVVYAVGLQALPKLLKLRKEDKIERKR